MTTPIWVITLKVSEAEACAMLTADIPQDVRVALISQLKSIHETPGEAIASMTRRTRKKPRVE